MKKGDEATWSELPEEFLEIIARRLTCLFDYVQFGAVCQSWHSTMVNMHQHLTFWDPWLMLPEKEDKSMIRSFYILSKRNIFELKLPEAHAKRCIGSSKGWLVMVDVSLSIQLLNPYTRVQVQLPHQMTFQDQNNFAQGYTSEELRDFFILKVVLSSSPSNPDYISIAIYSDWGKLAIARSGDEVWTTIPSEWFAFTDVIYYKEQFYAINWNGEVVSCDVGAHPKTTLITTPARESYGQKYLVECSGELLQVIREVIFEDAPHKTIWFSVFKLDFYKKLWVEIKSLGDHSLFLGYNNSFSFCCNDSSATGVKRDCIYFTDDYLKAHQGHHNEWAGSDMGVFHLEDGRIEPHYSGYACHPFSLPIWYTPNKG
ncbi:F-box protein At2g26160-like isoform X1 [Macadamia integrifolia]|uniref:F-box protein At2g26160-like isoform X1 n=1 Tax=Macadamia integrifolia TaxID=60698 RepID=UPI001C4FA61D|nr:F-box protein At2g26160-like isoform X1 [Macadamia integrifolia]